MYTNVIHHQEIHQKFPSTTLILKYICKFPNKNNTKCDVHMLQKKYILYKNIVLCGYNFWRA